MLIISGVSVEKEWKMINRLINSKKGVLGRKTYVVCLIENMNFSDRKISLWQNRGKLPLQGIEMKVHYSA